MRKILYQPSLHIDTCISHNILHYYSYTALTFLIYLFVKKKESFLGYITFDLVLRKVILNHPDCICINDTVITHLSRRIDSV